MAIKKKKQMPRPVDTPDPVSDMDTRDLSPLGVYLKTNGVAVSAFSKAIGMPMKTVTQWVRAIAFPSYPAIYEIERLTKGVVPCEAWLGMPQAKKMLAEWRSYQPKESHPKGVENDDSED